MRSLWHDRGMGYRLGDVILMGGCLSALLGANWGLVSGSHNSRGQGVQIRNSAREGFGYISIISTFLSCILHYEGFFITN